MELAGIICQSRLTSLYSHPARLLCENLFLLADSAFYVALPTQLMHLVSLLRVGFFIFSLAYESSVSELFEYDPPPRS